MDSWRIMEDILAGRKRRLVFVGASPKKERPVAEVMAYLLKEGFDIYPVNPGYAGKTLQGCPCVAGLRDVPLEAVDAVAFFLSPSLQASVLEELPENPPFPVLWFQPGAEHPEVFGALENRGYDIISGYCLMAEREKWKAREKA